MKHLLSLCIVMLCLLSCKKDDKPGPIEPTPTNPEPEPKPEPNKKTLGGVVLTFDDTYTAEWLELHEQVKEFDWKATFFVTGIQTFNTTKLNALKSLKSLGHEIGGHGVFHWHAVDTVAAHDLNYYIDNEITPMISFMRDEDLTPTSYSYPYGSTNSTIDAKMFDSFKMLRSLAYSNGVTDVKDLSNYYKYNKVRRIPALGIDAVYRNSVEYILSVLEHARDNDYIAVFYGHRPMENPEPASAGKYETSFQMVKAISKYVKDNEMKFYTFSELHNLEKPAGE